MKSKAPKIKIEPGDVIRDNDIRMWPAPDRPREVTIARIEMITRRGIPTACAVPEGNTNRRHCIDLLFIHTDDLPRKSGWTLVKKANAHA